MYLLGYDLGSSSVKVAIIDANTGTTINLVQSPKVEMTIRAAQPGWAEQDPETWYQHACLATQEILSLSGVSAADIKSIGISYQMHGLVMVDKNYKVLRPSIIWCDSRAVELGQQAFEAIGPEKCLEHHLNSPGNFTASKIKWVKDNEPEVYAKTYKIMLPGDYLGMRLTGGLCTTVSGLSEAVLWDFKNHTLAHQILDHYGISKSMIPEIKESFSIQGNVSSQAAQETGLAKGTPISYRAGDQPNNALSLGAFEANEVAATGGTSGVVYGIVDNYKYDLESRVNGFAHVNHSQNNPRVGQLLCINGAGIQYAWMKKNAASSNSSYEDMEAAASQIPIGSAGLTILPFGNGAERMLGNKSIGSQINNLQFNSHSQAHLHRAALEGIAFSFMYGFDMLKKLGLSPQSIKVGNDNLFRSQIFSNTITNLLDCDIAVVDTTGAIGAAKASGLAISVYENLQAAFSNNKVIKTYTPQKDKLAYQEAYANWLDDLNTILNKNN